MKLLKLILKMKLLIITKNISTKIRNGDGSQRITVDAAKVSTEIETLPNFEKERDRLKKKLKQSITTFEKKIQRDLR